MRNRPGALCVLEKKKLIDTQNGFVDTFNWMVDVIDELTKGNAKVQEVTLATDLKYDEDTHKFTIKTQKARVLVLGTGKKDETVFEATPMSDET